MERLNGDLKALVDAERDEVEPSPQELEGARAALLRRLGTAAAAGTVASTLAKVGQAGAAGAASGSVSGAGIGLVIKLGVPALLLGGVTAVVVPRWSVSPAAVSVSIASAPVAPVPAPSRALDTPAAEIAASPSIVPAAPREEPGVRAKMQPGPPPSGDRGAPPPLAEEVRLLKDAQAALKAGDAASALAALAEHQRRFPRGQLALERSAVRIGALCALGRTEEAKRAAAGFLERHGNSGLAEQVRGSCAGAGTSLR